MLTLLAAVGLVAVAAILKGSLGRHADEGAPTAPATEAATDQTSPAPAANPNSSNSAAVTEQLRIAEIKRELEQINFLVTEGTASPTSLGILVGKLTHPEPAVRGAALEAVKMLNDTNAIPGLEQAADAMENPRDKVTVMDAIAYLKLPNTMPDEAITNDMPTISSLKLASRNAGSKGGLKGIPNARAMRRMQRAQARGQQGAPAAAPPQAQQMPATLPQ
jgi:hypothetical protein